MYDAIIIGARVAGAPTAMLLAQKGYKVLLLDRDNFPSDTISTHIIFSKGFYRLKKWGLIDKIIATNAPLIRQIDIDLGPFTLSGTPPPIDGVSEIIAPRRFFLDKILVDAAVDAGVELRENCDVEELLTENGIVTGVRCRSKNGTAVDEKARIVIGADGRNSIVARTVKAEEYNNQPKLTCWYYTYWSGVPVQNLTMYSPPDRAIGFIPTNDDQVCIPITWPAREFQKFRSDIEGNYMKTFELVEGLSDMMSQAKREAPFVGMADLRFFFRKPYGPGWALIGDAAYHKDPITGQGISDALQWAEGLAEAVDAGLSGNVPMEHSLAKYQQDRDEEVMPMYNFTCEWATLAPPSPEMQQLFTAIYGNQEATDQFIGVAAGTVPFNKFFAPENIERIMEAHTAKAIA